MKRPDRLTGETIRYSTGHGDLYITVNRLEDSQEPFEVFLVLGKADNCNTANLEAIGRLASMSLRSGVPAEEVARQVRGITCCPAFYNGERIDSLADALAHALTPKDHRTRRFSMVSSLMSLMDGAL